MQKEQEGVTLRGVISAVMAGALIGYMLYESGVVDKVKEIDRQQRIEQCGPKLDHCPPPELDYYPAIRW